jgi:hypothetical protein
MIKTRRTRGGPSLPRLVSVCALVVALATAAPAVTLKEVLQSAPAGGGFDRYVVLETGVVYEGGFIVGATWDDDRQIFRDDEPGFDVKIVGNGAILDLQGQQICISFCRHRLEIEDCIFLNGGVRFRGERTPQVDRVPSGSVRHCTFYRPHDYAVRLQGAGNGITLERNIVVDTQDTGLDYVIWSGVAGENLPTGVCIAPSVQIGAFGLPQMWDNWTFFSDPQINADPSYHYVFL